MQQGHEHFGYLLLAGITIAGYGLLYFFWSILHNRNFARKRGSHGYTLRAAQLEHGLNVLAEKWCFQRNLVRVVFLQQANNAFKDLFEPQLMAGIFAEVNYAKLQQGDLRPIYNNKAIAHYIGAGVQTQDDLFFCGFSGQDFQRFRAQITTFKPVDNALNLPMFAALIIIILIYFLSLLFLVAGWRKVRSTPPATVTYRGRISVIVPFCNEQHALPHLLSALAAQEGVDYEVVLVDDGSRDDSVKIVRQFLERTPPGRFRLVVNADAGKKQALTTGIGVAGGEVIVTTDADCTFSKEWLSVLVAPFVEAGVQFVAGAVRIHQGGRFFDHLQAIEFASLAGTSGATLVTGRPTMCNGANLAYRKAAFEEAGGYAGNLHVASGDDEFLMRKVFARHPQGLRYVARAVVTTQAASTLRAFFRQRLRWAAKWEQNTSAFTQAVAVFVFLLQVAWLSAFYLAATGAGVVWPALLALRVVLECFFLLPVCRALGVTWHWPAFFALQILYPPYVIAVALASRFYRPGWKKTGRQPVS
jgi:poly-beta-1,6-N-acetyl-D-glucosamine synthase